MDILCKKVIPYICPKCNSDTLFFTTKSNDIIDYKTLFNNTKSYKEIVNKIEYKEIRYIKCINCGSIYIIDWSKIYPTALNDKNKIKEFGL